MKANELRYSRRNNLGDYSSEEITLSVFLEEGERPTDILPKIKKFVMDNCEKPALKVATAPVTPPPVAAAPKVLPPANKPLATPVAAVNAKIVEAGRSAGVTLQEL